MSGGLYLFYLKNGLIILGYFNSMDEQYGNIFIDTPIILDEDFNIKYKLMKMLNLKIWNTSIVVKMENIIFSSNDISEELINLWNRIYNVENNLEEYIKGISY